MIVFKTGEVVRYEDTRGGWVTGTICGRPIEYARERIIEYPVLLGDGVIVRVESQDLRSPTLAAR